MPFPLAVWTVPLSGCVIEDLQAMFTTMLKKVTEDFVATLDPAMVRKVVDANVKSMSENLDPNVPKQKVDTDYRVVIASFCVVLLTDPKGIAVGSDRLTSDMNGNISLKPIPVRVHRWIDPSVN